MKCRGPHSARYIVHIGGAWEQRGAAQLKRGGMTFSIGTSLHVFNRGDCNLSEDVFFFLRALRFQTIVSPLGQRISATAVRKVDESPDYSDVDFWCFTFLA